MLLVSFYPHILVFNTKKYGIELKLAKSLIYNKGMPFYLEKTF